MTQFRSVALSLVILFVSRLANAQTGIPVPQMASCDSLMHDFLTTYDIPGATFALAKDGRLVYHRGFGNEDLNQNKATQPHHRFRIASISKPLTSIGIMHLVEQQSVALSDKVFGTGGILENHPTLSTANITDTRIFDITVQQLLEHSAGWDRSQNCTPNPTSPYPYFAQGCDPISFPLHVTQSNGSSNPASEADMIFFLLEKGLSFAPGTQYAYSNIGYLVLGEIIEEISGKEYETFIREEVLGSLGLCDLALGRNFLSQKMEREVEYQGNGFTTLSCMGTGNWVPWEYGGFNIEAMSAHGGWVASARDLVRILTAVDGFASKPDILSATTINTMATPSATNPYYALGWQVNSFNNWWHTGSLDGTATFFARTQGGYTWAILLNKRIVDNNLINQFWTDFDALPWNCISASNGFPSYDLMEMPTIPISQLEIDTVGTNTCSITWNRGNGEYSLVVIKESQSGLSFPLEGISYIPDTLFGNGDDLGNGNYAIYSGADSTVTVSGLSPGHSYTAIVYSFNQNTSSGNFPLFHLCGRSDTSFVTLLPTELLNEESSIFLYPNPAQTRVKVNIPSKWIGGDIRLMDASGKLLQTQVIDQEILLLSLERFAKGFYFLVLSKNGYSQRQKLFVR